MQTYFRRCVIKVPTTHRPNTRGISGFSYGMPESFAAVFCIDFTQEIFPFFRASKDGGSARVCGAAAGATGRRGLFWPRPPPMTTSAPLGRSPAPHVCPRCLCAFSAPTTSSLWTHGYRLGHKSAMRFPIRTLPDEILPFGCYLFNEFIGDSLWYVSLRKILVFQCRYNLCMLWIRRSTIINIFQF